MSDSSKSGGAEIKNDPRYKELMSAFQAGEWDSAHNHLEKLERTYADNPKLLQLRREIDLRRQVDQTREKEQERRKEKLRTRLTYAALGLLLVIGAVYLAYQEFYPAINQEIEAARRQSEASSNFRNAEGLLQAGRAEEALLLLEEVSRLDPEYPGLEATKARAEELVVIENLYFQALELLEDRKYSAAQEMLEEIQEQEPNYRDVAILIEDSTIKANLAQELILNGSQQFQEENWEGAIDSFEEALAVYPDIAEENFLNELFYSYVFAAQEKLGQNNLSLEDLRQAEDYYRVASSLSLDGTQETSEIQIEEMLGEVGGELFRAYVSNAENILETQPDTIDSLDTAISLLGRAILIDESNEEVRDQYDLAKDFLLALEQFQQQRWQEAIEASENVIQHSPSYANGTAKQLLLEAHEYLAEEEFNRGLDLQSVANLQEAVIVADEEPRHPLQYFDANVRLANVLGQMERYEEAVSSFQDAIEEARLLQLPHFRQESVNQLLQDAEIAAFSLDYEQSFAIYRDALVDNMQLFLYSDYIVGEGDYMLRIARQFGTTTQLIYAANDMKHGDALETGAAIVIPGFQQ